MSAVIILYRLNGKGNAKGTEETQRGKQKKRQK